MAATDGNGATVRWRLDAAERSLERKADSKDLDGLARVVREGFDNVNARFDKIEERNEEDRQRAGERQRTLLLTLIGAATTILGALIASGGL